MTPDLTDVRAARAAIRFEITVDSGDEDVHSWALDHAFDVCELANLANVALPPEVAAVFRPTFKEWTTLTEYASGSLLADAWLAAGEDHGTAAADAALTYWARVLTRYLRLPAVAALAEDPR